MVIHYYATVSVVQELDLFIVSHVQAVAFLEPASTHLSKPLGFSIPALSYGTQLCMEAPKCCNEKYGYFHFYDELVCPKILMNVTVSYILT